MGKSSGTTTQLNSNINVTPLADVMLVLLIIFMVITPLLNKGVDLTLPEAQFSRDKPDNEDVVNVAILLDNAIYLNLVPIAESELVAKLSEAFEGKAEKILFLKADEGLEYRDVMRIMELCRDGGADEIGLITEKKTG